MMPLPPGLDEREPSPRCDMHSRQTAHALASEAKTHRLPAPPPELPHEGATRTLPPNSRKPGRDERWRFLHLRLSAPSESEGARVQSWRIQYRYIHACTVKGNV